MPLLAADGARNLSLISSRQYEPVHFAHIPWAIMSSIYRRSKAIRNETPRWPAQYQL